MKYLAALGLAFALTLTAASSAGAADVTTIKRPPTDVACDTAFDAQLYDKALPLCKASIIGYDKITQIAQDEHLASVVQRLQYDGAYTRWQAALCLHYAKTADADDIGHKYAIEAYAAYRKISDADWVKINTAADRAIDNHAKIDTDALPDVVRERVMNALTANEIKLASDFVSLMKRINALYPDVFADEMQEITPDTTTSPSLGSSL